MADPLYGLRCRPGDLAIIVRDDPECAANIGQIVRVLREYNGFVPELGFHWLIQPLSARPSPVVITNRANKRGERVIVYDTEPRGHLDAWLKPLKDVDDVEEIAEIALTPSESEWHDPAHLVVT